MNNLFKLLLFIIYILVIGNSHAEEASYTTAYLYDPSAKLQVSDLNSLAMENSRPNLRLGFLSGAVWIRITTQPQHPSTASDALPVLLRVGSFQLDRIELHEWFEGQWRQ